MNIILQHFDGELRELDKLSIDNIRNYADMVGAEYQLITGKPFRKHLTSPCQKVYMLDKCWDKYEDVLMLDIDMFAPKNMNENVFNYSGVGLYEDVQKRLHRSLINHYPLQSSLIHPYWGGAIYKLSLSLREKLRAGLGGNETWMNNYNKLYHFEDEGIIHTLACKARLNNRGTTLHRKWCQCSFLPNPELAGFIHVRTKITPQGPKREKIENYNELVEKGIL
tara:strand:+ start:261 stop:929 length:669 start_codon:yes stop_codon:yes gene_type:complete